MNTWTAISTAGAWPRRSLIRAIDKVRSMAVQIKILSARLEYRGVRAVVEWDEEAGLYRAVIKHQESLMSCQERSIKDLLNSFRSCANDFLQDAQVDSIPTETDASPDSDVQL
jgi:hypothetical protein